ncbi:uncharacterized protein LOC115752710 [Rhodamnia argentea]|uniref:RING-type E3 ubiquitin transferase n=1 Tax=Rhodamnia argentea TaxID=178133 RepID=A0ABM3GYN8_9MYRT|nr:uncharacterized protein LOC115752710 [Rhodamnia argentea]
MWVGKSHEEKRTSTRNGLVAVAVDKDKGSQFAIRWAGDHLLSRGQTVVLIHSHTNITTAVTTSNIIITTTIPLLTLLMELHPPNRNRTSTSQPRTCFSPSIVIALEKISYLNQIHSLDVVLEDTDVVRALTDYVSYAAIESLVLGASSRHGFIRLKSSHVPSSVSKGVPDFCTVYVISKGKVSSMRKASHPAPHASPLLDQIQTLKEKTAGSERYLQNSLREKPLPRPLSRQHESMKSTWDRGRSYGYVAGIMSDTDSDISFVSSGRPSTDRPSSVFYDHNDFFHPPRLSTSSDRLSIHSLHKFADLNSLQEFSSASYESGRTSSSSHNMVIYSHSQTYKYSPHTG